MIRFVGVIRIVIFSTGGAGLAKRSPKQSHSAPLGAGRKFHQRPDDAYCARFRAHIIKHGTPVTFPGLAWTKPDPDDPPKPLTDFATPETLRKRVPKSPCPICSPHSPKYYEGKLCWSAGDKRVRAIGHECGHDFYDGDTYADEVREFEEKAAEDAARGYLQDAISKLPEHVILARWSMRDFDALFAAREDLVATVTKRASQELLRALDAQGRLSVEIETGARDGQGRRVAMRQSVTSRVSVAGLKVRAKARNELTELALLVGGAVVLRRHAHPLWRDDVSQAEAVAAMDREQVVALERLCRTFEDTRNCVDQEVADLRALLSATNLTELSRWGTHLHCPTPFWISHGPSGVTAGKGPHTGSAGRRIRNLPYS
ncbi:hypothetical protein [Terricaulis silvestris]|uniref:Uncharacterized protein n=1 Tax=Terricaulis silvestris TaxID=2686094 RepID=A0A6I6MIM3_9CAUL|nr:hypothetical protein [Terricaulis silvestris]QGZ94965.1 hypothetical protein DSM104635_01800 [Terricaulis silvestris]